VIFPKTLENGGFLTLLACLSFVAFMSCARRVSPPPSDIQSTNREVMTEELIIRYYNEASKNLRTSVLQNKGVLV
jgi:hypothetical protein